MAMLELKPCQALVQEIVLREPWDLSSLMAVIPLAPPHLPGNNISGTSGIALLVATATSSPQPPPVFGSLNCECCSLGVEAP